MTFEKDKPYNALPLLPPDTELETRQVLRKAVSANRALAELKGIANIIPNPAILINAITLQEARSSSEIENVLTTNDRLFEAFSSAKGAIDPQTKEVLRYREAMWAGFHTLRKRPVFSTNFFVGIYQTIKQTNAGIRNTPGTIISDNRGNTLYTPPEGENLIRDKLQNLEDFIHNDDSLDPLIKLAVTHYQFEAIHPFTDGNGRTGRILNVLFLVYKGLLDLPILYLSQYIIKEKTRYYNLLRKVTKENDWEGWILFMLTAVEKTSESTVRKIAQINGLLTDTIEYCKQNLPSYMYSKEMVELLFEQPYCKVRFLVDRGIAKRQRASIYLKTLQEIGLVRMKKVGKENLYLNVKLYELLSG
jgi:Fic family protein